MDKLPQPAKLRLGTLQRIPYPQSVRVPPLRLEAEGKLTQGAPDGEYCKLGVIVTRMATVQPSPSRSFPDPRSKRDCSGPRICSLLRYSPVLWGVLPSGSGSVAHVIGAIYKRPNGRTARLMRRLRFRFDIQWRQCVIERSTFYNSSFKGLFTVPSVRYYAGHVYKGLPLRPAPEIVLQ